MGRLSSSGRFNAFERTGARMLEKVPGLRKSFKYLYQRFVYATRPKLRETVRLEFPVRLLTIYDWAGAPSPNGHSFFGYYDKSPWNHAGNCVLTHEVSRNRCDVVLLDRDKKERRIVGTTDCWNWQQGAMLQWVGKSDRRIAFNSLRNNVLGAVICDTQSHAVHFVPWPIQAIHPNGNAALSLNYLRLYKARPIYGYSIKADNFAGEMDPSAEGIWKVDLSEGHGELLINLAQLRKDCGFNGLAPELEHVNHCIFNPSGSRFAFLYRYSLNGVGYSRLYCASATDGSFRLLHCSRKISHYHWRDDANLLAWMRTDEWDDHYYLIDVNERRFSIVGEGVVDAGGDGHCSFTRDRNFVLSDTYPDKVRHQHLFIYDIRRASKIPAGSFFSPWRYYEDNRCDLHPRFSPDDRLISFDSAHTGSRMQYVLPVPGLQEN